MTTGPPSSSSRNWRMVSPVGSTVMRGTVAQGRVRDLRTPRSTTMSRAAATRRSFAASNICTPTSASSGPGSLV